MLIVPLFVVVLLNNFFNLGCGLGASFKPLNGSNVPLNSSTNSSFKGTRIITYLASGPSPKIIGGRKALPGEVPYQVALFREINYIFFKRYVLQCGGSILNNRWVITAAHCVFGDDTSTLRIAPGIIDLKKAKSTFIQVDSIYIPGGYARNDEDEEFDDIALIKLAKPIAMNRANVKPISLPKAREESNYQAVTISGFGAQVEEGYESRFLKTATVLLRNDSECKKIFKKNYDAKVQLCAGLVSGANDTCQGDSGGPLSAKRPGGTPVLLGITSYGDGCGRRNTPGVYTRVSAYINWIKKVMDTY